jgi:ComF family protein
MRAGLRAAGWLHQGTAAVFRACRDVVFPARCLACRVFIPTGVRKTGPATDRPAAGVDLLHPFFCPSCLRGVMPLESPLCPRCGVMFKARAGPDHLCGRCQQQPPAFGMARAAFVYDRTLVDVIHCFKYKGKLQLAAPLGRLLRQAYEQFWAAEGVDAILPVPLHRTRLRGRGFNQAELLVRRWNNGPAGSLPPILAGVLRRVRATPPQAGLGRRRRETNIRSAFAVNRPEAIAGGHLLLIDDVITTGATAAECAAQLLGSGAARVDVLALARVI